MLVVSRAVQGEQGSPARTEHGGLGGVAVIVTPGASWLVRATFASGRRPDDDACRLVERVSGLVYAPLPAPATSDTLAFAVPAGTRAEDCDLLLGDERVALPAALPRRFVRSSAVHAELDALDLRTQLSRAERRALELEAELRRRESSAAAAHNHAAHWRGRYREMRREAARLALHAREEESAPRSPETTPSRRGHIAFAASAALLAVAATIAIATFSDGNSGVPEPAGAATPSRPVATRVADIPARWVRLYKRAATRYGLDWTYLAAVGAVESEHGKQRARSSAGAIGPAQFLSGTWERFGLDGDGDGAASPHDPVDAVMAMAAYLRASGAPQDWTKALWAYNHSPAYGREVVRRAAAYRVASAQR